MERIGTGYAKLILFGEHAAVYGFPAVGLSLPQSTVVRITSSTGDRWSFPNLDTADRVLVERLFAHLGSFIPEAAAAGGEVRIDSSVPRGLGFGSSAALCVAIAEAFTQLGSPDHDIWALANRAEKFFHGTPSGIDTGLSLLRGLCAFRPSPPALPSARRLAGFPFDLVFGAVDREDSTAKLVGNLRNRYFAGESRVREGCGDLGETAKQAIALFDNAPQQFEAAADVYSELRQRLGMLMSSAHRTLRDLDLSCGHIDRMIAAGLDLGALGGKLSGAGGGGAFCLLFPSPSLAEEAGGKLNARSVALGIRLTVPISAFSFVPAEKDRFSARS